MSTDKLLNPATIPMRPTRPRKAPLLLAAVLVSMSASAVVYGVYTRIEANNRALSGEQDLESEEAPPPRLSEPPSEVLGAAPRAGLANASSLEAPKPPPPPPTAPPPDTNAVPIFPLAGQDDTLPVQPSRSSGPAASTRPVSEAQLALATLLNESLAKQGSLQDAQTKKSGAAPTQRAPAGYTGDPHADVELERIARARAALDEQEPPAAARAENGVAGETEEFLLPHKLQRPRSQYIVQAPWAIDATFQTGVDSTFQGEIIATVNSDVYDSITGKYLLIPRGTRAWASNGDVGVAQDRLAIVWKRFVFPDGSTLTLDKMPGADSSGRAGIADNIDHHYLRLFGMAMAMSLVSAGFALSQPQQQQGFGVPNAGNVLSAALGQQLGSATAQFLNQYASAPPTHDIRPGYLCKVVVVRDIVFDRPYQRE